MIQFILMLLGLAFSNNNAHTVNHNNGQSPVTVQNDPGSGIGIDPGDGSGNGNGNGNGHGNGGNTGGNTGQVPPPYSQP